MSAAEKLVVPKLVVHFDLALLQSALNLEFGPLLLGWLFVPWDVILEENIWDGVAPQYFNGPVIKMAFVAII